MDTETEKKELKKIRDYWFDNAKAFLIFTVVLGHMAEVLLTVSPYKTEPEWLRMLYNVIYVFHMPVFMIISGRFAKRRVENNDFVSVINMLIVPYLVCQTIMLFFYSFFNYEGTSDFSYLKPYYGLWYLLMLGIYQIITPHILKAIRSKTLFFILFSGLAILLSLGEKSFYGNFQRFFNYYPFFIFGLITSDFKFNFCKKIVFRILSLLAFILLVYAVLNSSDYLQVKMLSGKRVYSQVAEFLDISRLQFIIFQILRFGLGILFFFFVLGISPHNKNIFSFMGTNSTYIYILHLFVAVALIALGEKYQVLDFCQNEIYSLIFCILSFPLCLVLASPPFRKLFKWLVSPNFDLKKIAQQILKQ